MPISNFQASNKGFSLIELLVVIVMMAVLTSLGIASYGAYNGAQVVQSSAADVLNLMNTAKSQAISQVKPSACGTNPLYGYEVDIDSALQQYSMLAMCDPMTASVSAAPSPSSAPSGVPQGPQGVVIATKPLPPQIIFTTTSLPKIFFSISTGTVASGGAVTVSGYGKAKTITISPEGSMSIN